MTYLYSKRQRHLATHLVARLICLLGVPFTIYLATFYAHFSIMTRSGSGDGYMAFETQNELKGIPAIDAPLGKFLFQKQNLGKKEMTN